MLERRPRGEPRSHAGPLGRAARLATRTEFGAHAVRPVGRAPVPDPVKHPRPRCAAEGFTYLGLLFAIALLGALLGATGEVWHTVRQRDKEAELRRIGEAYRDAIEGYYLATPGRAKQFPKTLAVLTKDDRFPDVRRYLRKLYPDPITGSAEWGLVEAPDGGIAGVFSLSRDKPLGTMSGNPLDTGTTDTEDAAQSAGLPTDTPIQEADSAANDSFSTKPKPGAGYSAWVFSYAPTLGPPTGAAARANTPFAAPPGSANLQESPR